MLQGLELEALDPHRLKSSLVLCRLSLITVFQYQEGLTDRQAVDAVRCRLDWKYALHLPLINPGFFTTILREFRSCLLTDTKGQDLFLEILERLSTIGMVSLQAIGNNPSVRMFQMISDLTDLQGMAEQMSCTIEAIAACQPDFLRKVARPHWYVRYKGLTVNGLVPDEGQDLESVMRSIQEDARYLLEKAESEHSSVLDNLPEIAVLRRAWIECTGVR